MPDVKRYWDVSVLRTLGRVCAGQDAMVDVSGGRLDCDISVVELGSGREG